MALHVRRATVGALAATLAAIAGCASPTPAAPGPISSLTRADFQRSVTCNPTDPTCACVIDTSLRVAQYPQWDQQIRRLSQSMQDVSASSAMTDQILIQSAMEAVMAEAVQTCRADPGVVSLGTDMGKKKGG